MNGQYPRFKNFYFYEELTEHILVTKAELEFVRSCRGKVNRQGAARAKLNTRGAMDSVVENWNSTNEFICYGRQGELATNSRQQQEATTLSLQLFHN